jgi:hypothetical protein
MGDKYLETLLNLTNEYQMTLQLAGLLMQSISQLVEQKNATIQLKKDPLIVIENQYIGYHNEFIDAFPNIIEKTVYQQMLATQELKLDLDDRMNSLGSIIDQMNDLLKQMTLKAKFDKEADSPVAISVTQAYRWIENQIRGYQVDLIKKQILFQSIDFTTSTSSITAGWNICDDVDFREQVTIQERLKVSKFMAQL